VTAEAKVSPPAEACCAWGGVSPAGEACLRLGRRVSAQVSAGPAAASAFGGDTCGASAKMRGNDRSDGPNVRQASAHPTRPARPAQNRQNAPAMEKHPDITTPNETQITPPSIHCMTF